MRLGKKLFVAGFEGQSPGRTGPWMRSRGGSGGFSLGRGDFLLTLGVSGAGVEHVHQSVFEAFPDMPQIGKRQGGIIELTVAQSLLNDR